MTYNNRSHRRTYFLIDLTDAAWRKSSNEIRYIKESVNARRLEKPDCQLKLYKLNAAGVYRECELLSGATVDSSNGHAKKNCTRNGIVCGHRRVISPADGRTICHYLLDTGQKRNCPIGKECTHYTTEECSEKQSVNNFDWADFTLMDYSKNKFIQYGRKS